ncbi:Nucleoside-diphosphate-sugar epimerase [Singulisphaera sp. GP187]|uniref:SDR family oxidoreductase n=1 Tax=Singulisphaera sp. GP187 TaxID=1882752 RepID=UPI0009267BC7|nr:SDR family oxidoreductase [Singulisphaera sp. GP187]SIN94262.1 Nucleoside-diphosphate-sugar epimerase [Singulisphaera sp. GP187]
MAPRALVAGASGIVGGNLSAHLVSLGWEVFGLARKPPRELAGVTPLAADLREPESLRSALANINPNYVFITTWLRQATEAENCTVNGAMVRNLLGAVRDDHALQHVALVTGGKNYFGSFEEAGNYDVTTPFREEQPRKPGLNFYYTQEDILFEQARQMGFSWSVHRPPTIIGYALGNSMNMGVTLAVYASICRETGRPFVFPGSPEQYHGLSEVVDARILARQLAWAATTPAAQNQAFNIANGDVFRWDWMWERLANAFGLEVAPYPGQATPLQTQMRDAGPIWDAIVQKHGLRPHKVDELAPWWHTDADLGRTFETFSDMSKSRVLGFLEYQRSDTTFLDLFARLRNEKIIP